MTTLYLTQQYAQVRKDHQALLVRHPDGSTVSVPLRKVDQVVVMGDITLSAAAIQSLLAEGTDICYCTRWGRYLGRLCGDWTRHSLLRLDQFRVHEDTARSLPLARAFVRGKLLNMRTLILRGARRQSSDALRLAAARLQLGAQRTQEAADTAELMGIEGAASAAYFGAFGDLLTEAIPFPGRQRRPPRDPINALLSFGYVVLANSVQSAVSVVGLDPYIGFLHAAGHGKASLALDLAEEFRPIVVDSTVLTLWNNRRLTAHDFSINADGVRLSDDARRQYLTALEDRLATEARPSVLGARRTYNRWIEQQAREVARVVSGQTAQYDPILLR